MKKLLNAVKNLAKSFIRNEEGAQVIEYALIIAVVSITLIVALKAISGDDFNTLIGKVTSCLTTTSCP